MTIVLDQYSQFTLSNDLIILPREYVASEGAFETDSSAPGILMLPTFYENVNDVILVGRPFFQSAYIMVDLDSNTWTLWQANATTDTRLVSVGGNCAEKPPVNAPQTTMVPQDTIATNGTASNATDAVIASESAQSAQNASQALGAGAIAGIAVGAVFGVGLLAGILFLCWRKRSKSQARRSASDTDIGLTKLGHQSEQLTPIWHEKPGDDSAQELPSSQNYSYELPVSERPCEIPGGKWDSRPVELPASYTPRT